MTLREGDRVRFNARGLSLFGGHGAEGLLIRVDGEDGNVHWESGQDTRATIDCLERVND